MVGQPFVRQSTTYGLKLSDLFITIAMFNLLATSPFNRRMMGDETAMRVSLQAMPLLDRALLAGSELQVQVRLQLQLQLQVQVQAQVQVQLGFSRREGTVGRARCTA